MKKCFYYIISLFIITWLIGCNDEQEYPQKNEDEMTIKYDTLRDESTDSTGNEQADSTGYEPADPTGDEQTDSTGDEQTDSTGTYQPQKGEGFDGNDHYEPADSTGCVGPTDATGEDGYNGDDDRKGNGTDNNPHRRHTGISGDSFKKAR